MAHVKSKTPLGEQRSRGASAWGESLGLKPKRPAEGGLAAFTLWGREGGCQGAGPGRAGGAEGGGAEPPDPAPPPGPRAVPSSARLPAARTQPGWDSSPGRAWARAPRACGAGDGGSREKGRRTSDSGEVPANGPGVVPPTVDPKVAMISPRRRSGPWSPRQRGRGRDPGPGRASRLPVGAWAAGEGGAGRRELRSQAWGVRGMLGRPFEY